MLGVVLNHLGTCVDHKTCILVAFTSVPFRKSIAGLMLEFSVVCVVVLSTLLASGQDIGSKQLCGEQKSSPEVSGQESETDQLWCRRLGVVPYNVSLSSGWRYPSLNCGGLRSHTLFGFAVFFCSFRFDC